MKKDSGRMSREVRRGQIVQAALRIIGEGGVSGLTTAAIASRAGISEANLYRHFVNKDEILEATTDSIAGAIGDNFSRAFGGTAGPAAGLKVFFTLQLALMGGNAGIPRFMFSEELHGKPALRKRVLGAMLGFGARLESVIRDGQKTGAFSKNIDPRLTVLMFISMLQGLMFRWSLSGFSFSLRSEGMKLWKNFERCLLAVSSPPGRRK